MVLIALGGGTHPMTLGLLLVVLGAVMVWRPPVSGLGGLAGFCWMALFAWILCALWLPAAAVDWRLAAESLGVPISSSISPQPWVTLEALVGFLAGSACLLLAIEHKPDLWQRQYCVRLLVGTLTLLGLGAILAASMGWRLPWANEVHVFSWFPNRNQTALIFACGSVCSFGLAMLPWHRNHASLRLDRSSWRIVYRPSLWALLSAGVLLYAVFLSLSKGALIAWCCGMLTLVLLVYLTAINQRKGAPWLRVFPSLLILLFSFFVILGGDSRDRMIESLSRLGTQAEASTIPLDFRLEIYQDTFSMIADQPFTGVGLGQFRYVFPQYRTIPAAPVAMKHPESDWFWWTAELGVVGVVLIVLGLGALLLRLRKSNEFEIENVDPNRVVIDVLYRQILLAALVSFFVHSWVDVGAHRLGTVSLAIVLFALALPQTPERAVTGVFGARFWRCSGAMLLLLGILFVGLSVQRSPLLSIYASAARSPMSTTPLQWQPYFRAAMRTYPNNPKAALDIFYQVRFLVPDNENVPLREGLYLLRMGNDIGAFAAFSSTIQRSREPMEVYRQILRRTATKPVYHVWLRRLAGANHELIASYWRAVPVKSLMETMPQLIHEWPRLRGSDQKSILKKMIQRNFNDSALKLFEVSKVDKKRLTWPEAMQAHVGESEWEEALSLFDQWVERKTLPNEVLSDTAFRQLQSTALIHSQDPVVAARLIDAYISRGKWDEVRRTAERARLLPGAPTDLFYWYGYALAQTNRRSDAAQAYVEWLTVLSE